MIEGMPIGCKEIGAYIYIWISKEYRIAYVGQTHAKAGVVARAFQHVKPGGTLRSKVEKLGIDWDEVNDWYVLSFPLPSEPEFLSLESSFRLAVEYLVQVKLYQVQNQMNPRLRILSNVTCTPQTNLNYIIGLADKIVSDFLESYRKL